MLKQKRNSDEENFDEAVTYFRRAGTKHGIPDEIQKLFNDPACETIAASVSPPFHAVALRFADLCPSRVQSPNFWILLHAVRLFTQHSSNPAHLLPLSGALPDMKADTTGYVGLQSMYKAKAKEDLALVKQLLGEVLQKAGVEASRITAEEVETFVKHSAYLKVVRGRSLRMEEEASLVKGNLGECQSRRCGVLMHGADSPVVRRLAPLRVPSPRPDRQLALYLPRPTRFGEVLRQAREVLWCAGLGCGRDGRPRRAGGGGERGGEGARRRRGRR